MNTFNLKSPLEEDTRDHVVYTNNNSNGSRAPIKIGQYKGRYLHAASPSYVTLHITSAGVSLLIVSAVSQ